MSPFRSIEIRPETIPPTRGRGIELDGYRLLCRVGDDVFSTFFFASEIMSSPNGPADAGYFQCCMVGEGFLRGDV